LALKQLWKQLEVASSDEIAEEKIFETSQHSREAL